METRSNKKRVPPALKPEPAPVQPGQMVFVSVLPKTDIIGQCSDTSPKLFATQAAAQADCDDLNKHRHPQSQFVVRRLPIH